MNLNALAAELDQVAAAVSLAQRGDGPWPHDDIQRTLTRYGGGITLALAAITLAAVVVEAAPDDPYGWIKAACERMATRRLPVPWIAVDRALVVMRHHLTDEETEVRGGAEIGDVVLVLLMLRSEAAEAAVS